MEWIIASYDRRTDRDGQDRFTSESAFISAAEELLGNIWNGFVSATLPDGRVLDEAPNEGASHPRRGQSLRLPGRSLGGYT
jgi:hypothetical protein